MSNISNRITVIIRSVGERTEQLCRELILDQGIPVENLFIINEAPFSAALRKSFEIGLANGLPWTLCNDADVLLRPGAIEQLIILAEQQKPNVCEVQGYILDKFFGGPRRGGPHLYRTKLINKVIDCIPPESESIRPESDALGAMEAQGYPYRSFCYLTGIHDFEQYYRDIFRKCFVQAHKHHTHTELFLNVWRAGAAHDRDYQIALKGFAAGIENYDKVLIDTRCKIYNNLFSSQSIEEKPPLSPEIDFIRIQVEQIIQEWQEPNAYKEHFPNKAGLESVTSIMGPDQGFFKSILLQVKTLGFFKWLLNAFGGIFIRIGKWIKARGKN